MINLDKFITDATIEVKNILHSKMEEINTLLKSSNKDKVDEAKAIIIQTTRNCLDGKLSGLSAEDAKTLAEYLVDFKRENYLNCMKTTYYDDGFVYTSATIDLAICDYIVNYAATKKSERAESERSGSGKIISREDVIKNSKKPNRFRNFLNRFLKNDKELGE